MTLLLLNQIAPVLLDKMDLIAIVNSHKSAALNPTTAVNQILVKVTISLTFIQIPLHLIILLNRHLVLAAIKTHRKP